MVSAGSVAAGRRISPDSPHRASDEKAAGIVVVVIAGSFGDRERERPLSAVSDARVAVDALGSKPANKRPPLSRSANRRHAAGLNRSTGPIGSCVSRTSTRPAWPAAFTQLPPPFELYDALRQVRSVSSIAPPPLVRALATRRAASQHPVSVQMPLSPCRLERLGCHNHCFGAAGDAVVAGRAGLKCGK